MKLYYAPGTCSFAPHVVLREADIPFTLVRFDMKTRQLEGGGRLEDVNEKGFVPVLELDGGERLTEVPAVLQYIGDQKPELGLTPPAGTMARYRLAEWLNFIATEVHKIYWPLFHGGADVENEKARDKLGRSFRFVDGKLAGPFLMGDTFTVADAYLLATLNWARAGGVDLNPTPRVKEYRSRLRERPSVVTALEAEGLLKRA